MSIDVGGAAITEEELAMQGVPVTNVVGSPPITLPSSMQTMTIGSPTVGSFAQTWNWISLVSVLVVIVGSFILMRMAVGKTKKAVKSASMKKLKYYLGGALLLFVAGGVVGYNYC